MEKQVLGDRTDRKRRKQQQTMEEKDSEYGGEKIRVRRRIRRRGWGGGEKDKYEKGRDIL